VLERQEMNCRSDKSALGNAVLGKAAPLVEAMMGWHLALKGLDVKQH
jgi:hypothetical protein